MSHTVRSLSTSGLSPKKQIQCWTDALTELCGQFDVDPLEASSLEGQINYTTVSRLKLCQIEASQHRLAYPLSRAKSGEHPYVKILFQTYGISHFEQGGRRIELVPGDCLAYDVSCPHTIISPSLTRHEVVIVPKELLRERGFHSAKMSPCKLSARTGTGRIAYDFVHAAFGEAEKLSPYNAIGVADSLIDLLLLPLRQSQHRPDFGGIGLHQTLSAHVVQRQGHDRQRLYLAGKVAELPPGAGGPGRKNNHRCCVFVGLFKLVTFQPGLPEIFRNCSVFDPQGAARQPVPGSTLKQNVHLRPQADVASWLAIAACDAVWRRTDDGLLRSGAASTFFAAQLRSPGASCPVRATYSV